MSATAVLPFNPETDQLLIGEAARVVGVSVETLRGWSDAGRLPCWRIGNLRVFKRADLERVARDRAKNSLPELARGA